MSAGGPQRLSRRVTLRAASVVLLCAAGMGLASWWILQTGWEARSRQRLQAELSALDARLQEFRAAPVESLRVEERRLRQERGDVLEAWFSGRPAGAGLVRDIAVRHRLERLDVGLEGTVVDSSESWRTGLAVSRPAGRETSDTGDGPFLTVDGRRWWSSVELRVGDRVLVLAAESDVWPEGDRPPADVALWVRPAGSDRWIGRGAAGAVAPGAAGVGQGAGWLRAERDSALPGWRLAGALHVAPGTGLGVTGPLLVAALVALVGAVAGGVWAARPLRTRVRELVSSVDAVRAGRADFTFPSAGGDELDSLVGAFSALQRDLERQRDRGLAAERVAAWSDVARRVAHEVKNPLAPIRLTVQNLMRVRRRGGEKFDSLFEEGSRTILEEVEQLAGLVGEFSEFARLPAPKPAPTDVVAVVRGTLELFAAEEHLEIEARYPPDPVIVPADAEQLGRAFKNIVGNAVEAMAELPDGKPRRLFVEVSAGRVGVEITFGDSGPGIAVEDSRRVFEPYFTTKGKGTGLGMAITYRIITEHGGEIRLSSVPGEGTCVKIRLGEGERNDAARTDRR